MNDRGSIRLFRFRGIPVRMHWTFALIFLWVGYLGIRDGLDARGMAVQFVLVIALFACVVLHEFGHAFAARRYGIRTRDIILYPIGGVARLDRFPDKPVQELVVAIAGPLVNVVIFLLLLLVQMLFLREVVMEETTGMVAMDWQNLVYILFWMNVVLAGFNLLPAFPMDGGRVLRALLAMRRDRVNATRLAVITGRVVAFFMMAWAIWTGQFMLGLVAVFVLVMGTQEYGMVRSEQLYSRFTAGGVCRTRYPKVGSDTTVDEIATLLVQGLETAFPVEEPDGSFLSYVRAADVLRAVATGHGGLSVTYIARPIPAAVSADQPLQEVFAFLQADPAALVMVRDADGSLRGFLDRDQIDHVLYWAARNKAS